MKEVKEFILSFFNKEAEAWTKSELGDLDSFNKAVDELYSMATEDMDEAFGILKEDELEEESDPMVYIPRNLFKLTAYRNDIYGDIWIAYASFKNPGPKKPGRLAEGYIISKIDNEFKIIGNMDVRLDELYMEPSHWEASVYNPKNIDIYHLGEFVKTERYLEPEDDGFSLENYNEDKVAVNPILDEAMYDGAVSMEVTAEDNNSNRKVIESLTKKGVKCDVTWI